MKPAHALAGLTLCCLLLAIAFWAWPRAGTGNVRAPRSETKAVPESVEPDSGITPDKPATPSSDAGSQAPAKRKQQSEPPALPAFDTPFTDSFDALLEAAEHGNAQAGCRLTAEAQRCSFADSHLKHAPPIKAPEPGDDEEWLKQIPEVLRDAARKDRREQFERQLAERALVQRMLDACEGVDYSANAQADYIMIAANAGDIGAQLEYVKGIHLGTQRLLNNPQLLDQYRLNARPYFMNALEEGDLRAVPVMWLESQRLGPNDTSVAIPDEWVEQGFVTALIRSLTQAQRDSVFTSSLERYDVEPDPEQSERAHAFYERYFAHTPAGPSLRARWESPPMNDPQAFVRTMFNEELDRCR